MSFMNNAFRVSRIFHQLLKRIEGQDQRFSILKEAMIRASQSINTVIDELYSLRSNTAGQVRKRKLNRKNGERSIWSQLDELEKITIEKLHLWADEGKLSEHRELAGILAAWKSLVGTDPVKNRSFLTNQERRGVGGIYFEVFKKKFSSGD